MKLSAAVLSLVYDVSALTDAEIAKFGCRMNQPHVQFHNSQPAHASTQSTKFATAADHDGCHEKQSVPCYRSEIACSATLTEIESNGVAKLEMISNNIPDHYAWGFTPNGGIAESANEFRFPKVPSLLANGASVLAPMGSIGYAMNGVSFFSPYNIDCCDVAFKELETLDYCMGHPAGTSYHYHVMSANTGGITGCPMACDGGEVSGIFGIVADGFPLYGPMQYYSTSAKKIFLDAANCAQVADCELRQLQQADLDECGGQIVSDGSEADGTNYRYIVSGHFPYLVQCLRGDLTQSETNGGGGTGPGGPGPGGPGPGGPGRKKRAAWNGRWNEFTANGNCAINNEAGCAEGIFDKDFSDAIGCTLGNCAADNFDFSDLYFQCAGCQNEACTGGAGTTQAGTTTMAGTTTVAPTSPVVNTSTPPPMSTTSKMGPSTPMVTTTPPFATTGTTQEPTTTEVPFNPNTDCGFIEGPGKKELVQWKGKNNGKVIAFSSDSAIIRFNYFNTAQYDIVTDDYIGFLGIPKKICGMDFLRQIDEGNVSMTFNDYGNYYEFQHQYLRVNQAHSNMMVQIYRNGFKL